VWHEKFSGKKGVKGILQGLRIMRVIYISSSLVYIGFIPQIEEKNMNGRDALMLVREKYLEEEKGITTGKKADEYKRACEQYPAQMTTAHYIWARELTKNLP
jgi:hypothetical protein